MNFPEIVDLARGALQTYEIAIGSQLSIDATKKIQGEGFKRPWPPLIRMDAAVKAKVDKLMSGAR